jgi:hypothetical protein
LVDASVVGSTDTQRDLDGLQALVRSAFEQTRASGRGDWTVMTVPVLKNRLLNLTERQFSETTYGANSMAELIGLLPELVELDTSGRPPRVRLRSAGVWSTTIPHSRYQIRGDLWSAMVDFGRGEPYVWSGAAAVPAGEYTGVEAPKVLPTLTREEELGWRADFLSRVGHQLDDRDRERVEAWLVRQLSTKVLPPETQGQWSDYLKGRVVDRLRHWFRDNGIREPADLLHLGTARPPDSGPDSAAAEELRGLVIRCIHHMSFEELSELRLPARALLWVRD